MNLIEKINTIAKLRGTFTLRSWATSDTYFDKYKLLSDSQILDEIANNMVPLIPDSIEVLAWLEMGWIPLVTLLSHKTWIPAAFIRKEAKAYWTCKYAEWADLLWKKILLIEDIVTSGWAIIDAKKKLTQDNILVNQALCIIDREAGWKEALHTNWIQLISLFVKSDIDQ